MHASHHAWHKHNTTRKKKNSHKIRRKIEKDEGKGTKRQLLFNIWSYIIIRR